MIRYALICSDCDAEFEAWFRDSASFDEQKARGLIECISCNGNDVSKAIMAPSVKRSSTQEVDPAKLAKAFVKKARRHIADNFDYVGDQFADEARAIHYGEKEERAIWGQTTPEESAALEEEGVSALPLPDAFAPEPPKEEDELN